MRYTQAAIETQGTLLEEHGLSNEETHARHLGDFYIFGVYKEDCGIEQGSYTDEYIEQETGLDSDFDTEDMPDHQSPYYVDDEDEDME